MGRSELPNFTIALRSAAESHDLESSEISLGAVFGSRTVPTSTRATISPQLSWPACLNDLVGCTEYIDTLMKSSEEEFADRWDVPTGEGDKTSGDGKTSTTGQSYGDDFGNLVIFELTIKAKFDIALHFFIR